MTTKAVENLRRAVQQRGEVRIQDFLELCDVVDAIGQAAEHVFRAQETAEAAHDLAQGHAVAIDGIKDEVSALADRLDDVESEVREA